MSNHERVTPSRVKKLLEKTQNSRDRRLVSSLDKVIRKAQPNAPDDLLPKLRRYMIDTSKMPEFVRKKRHKRLERYETREQTRPKP